MSEQKDIDAVNALRELDRHGAGGARDKWPPERRVPSMARDPEGLLTQDGSRIKRAE